LLARLQRLGADYQNYQKRVQKDIANARDFANESLLKDLLSVLDDMERALAAAKENHASDDPLLKGMQMVHDNLLAVLARYGLTAIEAAGLPFDPEKHAALSSSPPTKSRP
jgi:molecular chaperone GrpE